jgi:hypothetical protein
MIGKRVSLEVPCPGCGEKHDIWFPGSDTFDITADNQFQCPADGKAYRLIGIGAADLEVEQEPTDVLGWIGETESTDGQVQSPKL